VIDIHCHILPGIDDGARDIGTSVEMLKIAEEDGLEAIVATPHYNEVYYNTDFREVEKYIDNLKYIAEEKNINIAILPGQEINIRMPVLKLLREGVLGCLNKTKYMLLELNYDNLENSDFDVIYELRVQGIVPVIPHPERYSYIVKRPSKINNLINEGCLFQLNEGSIKGLFGNDVKKTADILLKHGICSFIASDAHSTGKRSPRLKDIYNSIDEDFRKTVKNNSYKLINNEDIYFKYEKVKEKQSFFDIFKR
jgi:protein-tyrosine phosphatase